MKIIAHRGASGEFPENTTLAFDRALEIGLDGIEVDVLLTKDDVGVIRHDDLVFRMGKWEKISELNYEDLSFIDVGRGQKIPKLTDFLDTYGKKCPIVFDVKDYGVVEKVYREAKLRNILDSIHVTSFILSEITWLSKENPDVSRSLSMSSIMNDFNPAFEQAGVRTISLHRGNVTEGIIRELNRVSAKVRVYTVNRLEEAKAFASWGVEAIYTDIPEEMKKIRS